MPDEPAGLLNRGATEVEIVIGPAWDARAGGTRPKGVKGRISDIAAFGRFEIGKGNPVGAGGGPVHLALPARGIDAVNRVGRRFAPLPFMRISIPKLRHWNSHMAD